MVKDDENDFGNIFEDFLGKENPLKNIFGMNSDDILNEKFNAFAEGLKDKKKPDKKETIKSEIKSSIQNKNKEALEKKIKLYSYEVMLIKDNGLFEVFALGNLYIENPDEAINSLNSIAPPKNNIKEALGLIYHQKDDFENALRNFQGISFILPTTNIAKSQASYFNGNDVYKEHLKTLFKLTENSAEANNILGTLCFNKEDYNTAENYFNTAVKIKPEASYIHLNILKTNYKKDKNKALSNIGEFIYTTNISMAPDDLIAELEKEKIEMKRYKPKNLYGIVMQLL